MLHCRKDVTIPNSEVGHGLTHRLTTQIPYTQCNQCHNQGMPDLYAMQFEPRPDLVRVKASPIPNQESPSTDYRTFISPVSNIDGQEMVE